MHIFPSNLLVDSSENSKPIPSCRSSTAQPECIACSPPKSSPASTSASIPYPAQKAPCDAVDAFDFYSDSESPFFTPMTGSAPSESPASAIFLGMEPLELPEAQSDPPSPFIFPGDLVGFSDSLGQVSNEVSSLDVPVIPFDNIDDQTAPMQLPLLFQSHFLPDHPATSPGSQVASKQTSCASHCTCPGSSNAVGDDSVLTSAAASVISQVQLLGNEAMSAYKSRKLSVYEVESAIVPTNSSLANLLIYKKCQPSSPRETLETSYNSLVDTGNAISMQQALILSDIGSCIQRLLRLLEAYDKSNAVKTSIDDEIRYLETENHRRALFINFFSLELHRSTCSSYGPSFLQKNRLLYIRLQRYLNSRAAFQIAASAFLNNPSLLREDPACLSQLFPLD